MKSMKITAIFLAALLTGMTISAQQKLGKKDLLELRNRMSGAFNSEAQSKSDSSYFHIQLHMAPIWNDRTDGYWLYVEQAVATDMAKPYRQRIYHLYQENDTTLVSKVFEIPAPTRFAGAYQQAELLGSITVDSLIDRQGCAIYLHKNQQGDFAGSTPGKACLSSLRGAAYATSEVVIEKDKLLSWDRGWDATDKQKWGAVKGGYQFIKQP